MVDTLSNLPSGWINARLEELVSNPKTDLVDGPFGSNLKSSEYVDSGVPVLKIQNIKANRFVRKKLSYVTPEKASELSRHSFVAGDLMITKLGEPLGLCCKIPSDLAHGIFVADLMRLRPCDSVVDPTFLLHCINSDVVQNQFKEITKGTTRQRVNLTIVRSIEIQLPPMAEQSRIVAKIEELFSELDKGIESLKTAQTQLKVYRQALLKHAFEGKLTAQWRADNPDKLETAEALLERIQRERAKRYQREVAKWTNAGKPGSKPKAPKPLEPLTGEELAELPELPEGWAYSRLGVLIDEPSYGTSKKCDYETEGIGVLRIPNVVSGKIDASDLKFAEFDDDEIASYRLADGDLLIIRSNGSVSIVGRCALVSSKDVNYLYAGYLIRLRPNQRIVKPAYLLSAFATHEVRKQIEKKAKSTSGVNNINTGEIQAIIVAVCGTEEQQQIQTALDAKLSEIDQLEQTLTTSLQQAEVLRQSILKKAFSGQLIPQDPTDEPASELLARIKAERSATPKNKKARK